MLKRMTVYNFKWFLHTMLFIHTQQVIQKQTMKNRREEDEEGTDIEEEEEWIFVPMYVCMNISL